MKTKTNYIDVRTDSSLLLPCSPPPYDRKSIRLPNYDYSQSGAYFVTIHNNHKISFGDLINGKMMLNKFGHVVRHEWKRSAKIRREINLDGFIILPNHFHAIIHIVGAKGLSPHNKGANSRSPHNKGANSRSPLRMEPKSLSSLIAGFKSSTTVHINNLTKKYGISTWQRGFYDRVIRSESELWYKREYIRNNPLKHWKQTFSL